MQDEWDIEMADDEEDTLIPDGEQSRDHSPSEGTTIQDILTGGHDRRSYLPQLTTSIALFAMQAGSPPVDSISTSARLGGITLHDISRLLAQSSPQRGATIRNFGRNDDDDEDDEDEYEPNYRAGNKWFPEVTEPQQAGVELLRSGDFGRVADKLRSRRSDINVAKLVYKRSMKPELVSYKEDYATVRISDTTSHYESTHTP